VAVAFDHAWRARGGEAVWRCAREASNLHQNHAMNLAAFNPTS
jgi:hypothetical protein